MSRSSRPTQPRTNEYFVPKDGIDREVITADICRYLGNDALVRPGNYENPNTRQVQQGYFITAYRNLTTEMIADLKADSQRWEAERRQTASRGQPSGVEYRSSTTHQSRQYYGPTESGSTPGYSQTPQAQAQVYDSGPQYQQGGYAQPSVGYAANQGYATPDSSSNYYVAGADLRAAQPPASQPRTVYAQPNSSYPQDGRTAAYYAPPAQPVSAQGYAAQQPSDPFYGRAVAPAGSAYDTPDVYESNYSQGPSTSGTTSTSGSSRRRDDRDSDRETHRRRHR